MRFILSLFALPLAFALLTGCASSPERRLGAPMIELTRLDAPPANAQSDAYVLTARLTNPNTVPLVINRATHTLFIEGRRVGRFEDREPVGLPALTGLTHAITLPPEISAALRSRFENNRAPVPATLESSFEILIGTDQDTITVRNTGQGTLAAP